MAQRQLQAHVLPLTAASSLDSVRSALARLESCEALLVFPPGAAPALTQPSSLAALRAFCGEQEIDAVFIGGDEALRAMAVAEGFAAATSIDAWETHITQEAALGTSPPAEEWADADAALAGAGVSRASGGDDSGARWHADPPAYVLRLLGGAGGYSGPRDEPTPQEAERLLAEDATSAATDPLLRALHDFEERMTATIRDTGRLPAWQPTGR